MKNFIILVLVLVFTIVLFAQNSNKEDLTKLYIATFDRAPDTDGINYWMNTDMSIEDIAKSFFDQDETKNKYPTGISSQEFIDSIYQNIFKRSPDSSGKDYWLERLNSGDIEKSNFILAVMNGAINGDKLVLEHKTQVADYFMLNNLNDTDQAKKVMSQVTSDRDTVDSAKSKIDSYLKEEEIKKEIPCSKLDYGNGKKPFDGTYVKVDSLGNVCTKENGEWKSFFPMMIYPANEFDRPNFADYTVGGRFNTMLAWNMDKVQVIKDAGMKAVLTTDIYKPGSDYEGKFATDIEQIKNQGLMETLLFYHTDYEHENVGYWSWHEAKQSIIAQNDPNGHPHWYPNGNPIYNPSSAENMYLSGNYDFVDILGVGIYERWEAQKNNGPTVVIHAEEGKQNKPMVMAHIAYGVGGPPDKLYKYPRDPVGHRFAPLAMGAVAQGAKGIVFWQDYGKEVGIAVEDNAWWDNDLPKFNSDIKKMMSANIVQSLHNPFDIICNSHIYTDEHNRKIVLDNIFEKDEWGYYLIPDDGLSVTIGTRVVNGKGYAIISNWNSLSQYFECSVNIEQMGYSFSSIYDFIYEEKIGSVDNNIFKVVIPAYSWKVVEFR